MSPVRFIHTSDVHLDTSFSGAGFPSRLGDRKREAIRATFRGILEDARRLKIDIVLVAGDLFEHDRVTPDTIEFLKQQFSALNPIPVFIAPGNHDPCFRGSPYLEETWPENVHIFKEEEFLTVELAALGVRITGFAFTRFQLPDHIFRKLPVLDAGAVNLVVAHGSDVSRVPAGKAAHAPLTIDEIAGKNVHYCALGHYHQQRLVENSIDATAVWYSGIPEGRGWDEEGTCGYLVGEIDESGSVQVKAIPCNQYPLRTISLDCEDFSSREQIIDALLGLRGSRFDSSTILRIRLTGSVDPRLDLSTAEMEERLGEAALYFKWEDQTTPAIDFDALAREETLRGSFVRTMNERIAASEGDERPMLERARLYGVQALLGREVIPR